jgi:hypothetical protein
LPLSSNLKRSDPPATAGSAGLVYSVQLFAEKERSLPRLPNGIFLSHSIGVKPVRFLFNWGEFNRGVQKIKNQQTGK